MEEPHQILTADEEETIVTPRFDDEETVVARRVVPLEEVGQSEPVATPTAAVASAYPPERPSARRSWPLALVIVSALAGAVLGGTGLYIYQHREAVHANNRPAAAPPVASSQPVPAPTLEVAAEQPSAPTASQNSESRADESGATSDGGANAGGNEAPKDASSAPEAEQRKAGAVADSPKHGKKGDRDEEIERNERRAKRADSDDQLSHADTDADGAPVARKVDTITIFDRPRRAERRDRTRQPSGADRLRRIFEGQPQ